MIQIDNIINIIIILSIWMIIYYNILIIYYRQNIIIYYILNQIHIIYIYFFYLFELFLFLNKNDLKTNCYYNNVDDLY